MKCEFSLAHYKECIELARDKGYTIKPVKDYDENKTVWGYVGTETIENLRKKQKVILMRHDIDFSLEYAYELANFEYDLGVKSSYYVYLHSPTYNALSPKSMGMIKAMKGMGHEIGAHIDSRYSLSCESNIISDIIDQELYSYSQHLPGLTKKQDYQGLLNSNDLDFKYISDSGRYWREGCMCNWIDKKDKLHILLHPEWWVKDSTSREDVLHNLWMAQQDNTAREIQNIKQLLHEYVRDDLKLVD